MKGKFIRSKKEVEIPDDETEIIETDETEPDNTDLSITENEILEEEAKTSAKPKKQNKPLSEAKRRALEKAREKAKETYARRRKEKQMKNKGITREEVLELIQLSRNLEKKTEPTIERSAPTPKIETKAVKIEATETIERGERGVPALWKQYGY